MYQYFSEFMSPQLMQNLLVFFQRVLYKGCQGHKHCTGIRYAEPLEPIFIVALRHLLVPLPFASSKLQNRDANLSSPVLKPWRQSDQQQKNWNIFVVCNGLWKLVFHKPGGLVLGWGWSAQFSHLWWSYTTFHQHRRSGQLPAAVSCSFFGSIYLFRCCNTCYTFQVSLV